MKTQQTNYALNAIRTIAAFLVVAGHLQALFFVDYRQSADSSPIAQLFYLVTSLGHPAVIVFFVLSGYWVGGQVVRSTLSGSFTWRHYLTSRLTRLWLVLIPAIVLTQCLDRFGALVSPSSDIYKGSLDYHTVVPVGGPLDHLGVIETLGNVFFVQTLHVSTLGTNTPLWSLAYEFWYYIIFPAAFLACTQNNSARSRLTSAFIALIGVIIAGGEVAVYFPVWLAGAALAWKSGEARDLTARLSEGSLLLIRVLAASLLLASCAYNVAIRDQSLGADYLVSGAAVILVGVLIGDAHRGRTVLRGFSLAAEWSYSLYALHLPILAFIASLVVPLSTGRWQFSLMSLSGAAAILLAVSVLCWSLSLVTEAKTPQVRRLLLGGHRKRKSRQLLVSSDGDS